ncbi:hypothetical protein [Chitinophaga nivalis]|uniref:Uncharacterized protein n=1 Tax=Chitinophaga nivalis TaxID=2991709 RepID=A0ABT3IIU2_9BACT|nr:hypothetical protein [Chitinophaga nivalis]MCW3466640.1 hypothetical protein [Chitinophaga nivalis]MCW3483669.1 hypothetical protein [Chitinophaga nivalis]
MDDTPFPDDGRPISLLPKRYYLVVNTTMELPVIQYRRHRVAFTVVAVTGLGVAVWAYAADTKEDGLSFWSWVFLILGLIIAVICGWRAINRSVILELNHTGIQYKKRLFTWDKVLSYAIRVVKTDTSDFHYLLLRLNGNEDYLEIQLDWLDNYETLSEYMAAYADVYKVTFDGLIQEER